MSGQFGFWFCYRLLIQTFTAKILELNQNWMIILQSGTVHPTRVSKTKNIKNMKNGTRKQSILYPALQLISLYH